MTRRTKKELASRKAARTKLMLKFWTAMYQAGFDKSQEWEAQERIWVADLTAILKNAGPAPNKEK